MADKIRLLIEDMLPDMLNYIKRQIFSKDEVHNIMQEREKLEYSLLNKNVGLKQFLKTIEFEYQLEKKRRTKFEELKLRRKNSKDFAIIRRIIQLWDRLTHKFKYNLQIWKQYLTLCYALKSKRLFFKAVTTAIRFNPFQIDLWILAVYYEFEINKNPFKARKIFYKALKLNQKNKQFWVEYFKFEIKFLEIIMLRKQVLSKKSQTSQSEQDNMLIEEIQEEEKESPAENFLSFKQTNPNNISQHDQDFSRLENSKENLEVVQIIYDIAKQKFDQLDISVSFLVVLNELDQKWLDEIRNQINQDIENSLFKNNKLLDEQQINQNKVLQFYLALFKIDLQSIEASNDFNQDSFETFFDQCMQKCENCFNQLIQQRSWIPYLFEYIGQLLIIIQRKQLLQKEKQQFSFQDQLPHVALYIEQKVLIDISDQLQLLNQENNNIDTANQLHLQQILEIVNKLNLQNEEIIKKIQSSLLVIDQKCDTNLFLLASSIIPDKKIAFQALKSRLQSKTKSFPVQEIYLLLLKMLELTDLQNSKQLQKLVDYCFESLLIHKTELEKFFVKFFDTLNAQQKKQHENVVHFIFQKMLSLNQSCPLKIYLIFIQQLDWEDKKNASKITTLFQKISNWYSYDSSMWSLYLKWQKQNNPELCPDILEQYIFKQKYNKAAKTSGIKYQELVVIYTRVMKNSE